MPVSNSNATAAQFAVIASADQAVPFQCLSQENATQEYSSSVPWMPCEPCACIAILAIGFATPAISLIGLNGFAGTHVRTLIRLLLETTSGCSGVSSIELRVILNSHSASPGSCDENADRQVELVALT